MFPQFHIHTTWATPLLRREPRRYPSHPKPYQVRMWSGGKMVQQGAASPQPTVGGTVRRAVAGGAGGGGAGGGERGGTGRGHRHAVRRNPQGGGRGTAHAPLCAVVKEEEVATPPMPPGALFKEEHVPPMPPDAVIEQEHEVVVKEEGRSDDRRKMSRKK